MSDFSHIDENGLPAMVDVGDKNVTKREAVAQAEVHFPNEVLEKLVDANFVGKKGSIIQTAILAGIMAAKKTGELIPLCHPIGLDNCDISIKQQENILHIDARANVQGKTGVEMEALTAVSVAALTVYDMCKALSHDIVIKEIKLISKSGGKSDFKRQ